MSFMSTVRYVTHTHRATRKLSTRRSYTLSHTLSSSSLCYPIRFSPSPLSTPPLLNDISVVVCLPGLTTIKVNRKCDTFNLVNNIFNYLA